MSSEAVTDAMFRLLFPGVPEDGHQEEGGTAEAAEGEIWNQHRPTQVGTARTSPPPSLSLPTPVFHLLYRHITVSFWIFLLMEFCCENVDTVILIQTLYDVDVRMRSLVS